MNGESEESQLCCCNAVEGRLSGLPEGECRDSRSLQGAQQEVSGVQNGEVGADFDGPAFILVASDMIGWSDVGGHRAGELSIMRG